MLRTNSEGSSDNENLKNWINRHLMVTKEANNLFQKIGVYSYILNGPTHILLRKLGFKINHNYIVPIILKKKYGLLSCGKNVSDSAIASSWHEPEVELALNEIKKGTFLDIGAHIGRFSIQVGYQLQDKGKVISIEAHPIIFQKLYNNIILNKSENIFPYFCAASNIDGQVVLHTDNLGVGGGHSISGQIIKENARKIVVPSKTVDTIMKELKINDLVCIKLDVECAESLVLDGAAQTLKKFKPSILFEAMDNEEYSKVMNHLKKFNYKTKKLSSINYLAR